MLHVQPRDAGTEPKFNIATLKPSPDKDTKDYCYPGIPLDDAELREQEDDCQFNCSRISIEFKDSQGKLVLCGCFGLSARTLTEENHFQ